MERLNFIEGLYSDNDNVERATGTEGNLCSMPYQTVVQAGQILMKKLWEPVMQPPLITVQTEVVTVNDSGRCSIRATI